MLHPFYFAASETEEAGEESSAPPSSPLAEQKALFTTQTSTEEIRTIKTVLCDGVPPQVLNKQVLTRHFSRFGNVLKVRYQKIYLAATTVDHFE